MSIHANPLKTGMLVLPSDEYDLTVAYRIYPRVSKTPPVFPRDKLKLAELCLRSFRDSIGPLKVKLLVLLDGCPPEYAALFGKYFAPADVELIPLAGGGNRGTFSRQMELLLAQSYSELVYFAEDDYFYLPGQFGSMVRFLRTSGDVHFTTPYDHLDYYTAAQHHYAKRRVIHETRGWRTVASTCMTFLTSKTVLRQTQRVFRSYVRSRFNTDFGVWSSLTKFKVRNPITALRGLTGEWSLLTLMGCTWYYNWRQVMFGKKWNLWAPTPTIATHMDNRSLPPHFDWQTVFADEVRSLV